MVRIVKQEFVHTAGEQFNYGYLTEIRIAGMTAYVPSHYFGELNHLGIEFGSEVSSAEFSPYLLISWDVAPHRNYSVYTKRENVDLIARELSRVLPYNKSWVPGYSAVKVYGPNHTCLGVYDRGTRIKYYTLPASYSQEVVAQTRL